MSERPLIERMAEQLRKLLRRYESVVSSGDCGHWDWQQEPEVVEPKAILAEYDSNVGAASRQSGHQAEVICANCHSPMPKGCEGIFKDELECAFNGGITYTALAE